MNDTTGHHTTARHTFEGRTVARRAAAAALVAVTLAGCGGSGGGSAGGTRADAPSAAGGLQTGERAEAALSAVPGAPRAPRAPRAGTAQAPLLTRAVIQRAALTVYARNVANALFRVRGLVGDARGYVADEHTETGSRGRPRRSTLTLRVPVDAFQTVLGELGNLGRLGSQQVSTEDVSTQLVDVEARIVSAERTLDRIRELLESADDFSDVLSLEGELARREADLASLQAQQAYLEDQTSLSTITLTLLPTPQPRAEEPDTEPAGFVHGLRVGWDALAGLVTVLLTALGVLVPLLTLLLPAAVLLWWVLRRLREAARRRQPAQPPAT
jgi:Domain of unknown function (DUF4349)